MPLNINFQQILLHMFNFVILAFGLYMLLYKPVVAFMKKREDHFADLEKQAQKIGRRGRRRCSSMGMAHIGWLR